MAIEQHEDSSKQSSADRLAGVLERLEPDLRRVVKTIEREHRSAGWWKVIKRGGIAAIVIVVAMMYMGLYGAIVKKLGLKEGEDSTSDMLFTVETVNCLGACGLSPAMVINDEVYGQLTPQRVSDIIDEIVLKEAHNESDAHGA